MKKKREKKKKSILIPNDKCFSKNKTEVEKLLFAVDASLPDFVSPNFHQPEVNRSDLITMCNQYCVSDAIR